MSYKTYTTDAIVCGSTHSNTSDKSYLLFTKDAGMIWATARSVREERSKQRYALQDFSLIRISLVKGKSGWRIGSVESFGNPFLSAQSRVQRGCINHIFAQLRRYVHGEVSLPKVYDDVISLLKDTKDLEEKWLQTQQLFSVRLLSELGYIAPEPVWSSIIEAETFKDALEAYTPTMEAAVCRAVKEAAEASHL